MPEGDREESDPITAVRMPAQRWFVGPRTVRATGDRIPLLAVS